MHSLLAGGVRIILGLVCLFTAFFVGIFAWISFSCGQVWFSLIPCVFTLGLLLVAGFLVFKRQLFASKTARLLVAAFFIALFMTPALVMIRIRYQRRALQTRATDFLSRPIPIVLNTNELGGIVARGENVLSDARRIVTRYANNGRIRWSARIQGEFAIVPFGLDACEDVARTNEEARVYIAECKALLDEEWNMGFWQWVEDTIEMKRTIPEHEEENSTSFR
jgi:hypothetical protein